MYNSFDNNRYYSDSHTESKSKYTIVVVALISALIGAVVMAVIAPQFIYGKIIPWPNHLSNSGGYQLPSEPPTSVSQIKVDIEGLGNQFSQVAKSVGPAVVGITNKGYVKDWFGNTSLTEKSSGTGFIVDPKKGYVVTNEHVISGAKEVVVTLSSGTKVQAEVVGSDEYSDLAVLKINLNDLSKDEQDLPYVTFGDSSTLQVGNFVLAIGNPLGAEFARTTTHGIVSAVDRVLTVDGKQYSLLQIDAAINEGNSGGPLLDLNGKVVGINTIKIKSSGVEGLGFAIPSKQAQPIIEQLISYGKVIRPLLGIHGAGFSPGSNQFLQGKVESGVYVSEVMKGKPAEKAGIKAGDIIVAINDKQITGFTDLQSELFKHKKGDQIEVEVYRMSENKNIKLRVVLDSNE
ncbi:trypsin-like peptidase domain-containing protein [Clostridium sp. 'deep sea']|uniref:S1C family serine protease n=1 Tax=Clostridium sp. 'deep sea' TaxID=2779445 RepID=UPI0018969807|nr:trypsin-like peptidase domain-containing protein [Clostridium sp. 'deep sea']QOR33979.1 trypsin-like peptidase domain-containing protein [Clostridium sp. 'deep sea']